MPSRQSKEQSTGWVFVAAGAAIGLFVAFLFYLQQQPSIEKPSLEETKQKIIDLREEKIKEQAAKALEAKTKQEGAFDYHTILPELEVVVPELKNKFKTKEQAPTETTSPPATASAETYVLQAGAFSDKNQAEEFKAKIAFLGLRANLESVKISGKLWYRVRLGPYTDKAALSTDQARLQQNQIKSIVLQLKDE